MRNIKDRIIKGYKIVDSLAIAKKQCVDCKIKIKGLTIAQQALEEEEKLREAQIIENNIYHLNKEYNSYNEFYQIMRRRFKEHFSIKSNKPEPENA